MLEQTKNTISALLKAGLKRSDFRVRTPRRVFGYDATCITLLCPIQKVAALTPNLLAEGLAVEHYTRGERVLRVCVAPGYTKDSSEQFERIPVEPRLRPLI